MNELISRAILSGIGFASLTRDAIRETAEEFVKQSKLSEEEGRRLVESFQGRTEQAHKALEKKVNAAVRKAVKQFDLEPPGRQEKAAKPNGKGASKRPPRRHPSRAGVAAR